jgi:hypothetical protein
LWSVPFLGNAQRLLTEDFNYSTGDLYGQGGEGVAGWVKYSTDTEDFIQVVSSSLTYSGYQDQAIGNAVELKTTTSGQDLKKRFSDEGTGSSNIYVSFLAEIKNAKATTTNPTYFFCLVSKGTTFTDGSTGSGEFARIFIKEGDNTSLFKIGVSCSNITVAYCEDNYNLNETYLIALKYEKLSSTSDKVSLFINPVIGTIEPDSKAAQTTTSGSLDPAKGFDAVELRQGASSSFSRYSPNVIIDAIRVSTTWAGLFDIWKGTSSGDWNTTANWEAGVLPSTTSTAPSVIIPAVASTAGYPTLTAATTVHDITFKHGAQIGRPDFLDYQKAYFELDYTKDGMTNHWHMLSMPLKGVVSGDLAFGGKPSVFLRKFDASVPDNGSWMQGNWSAYQSSNTVPFAPAEGFISWVNESENTNLEKIGGILKLPNFENTDVNGYNLGNPYHEYDKDSKKSTFYYFDESGELDDDPDELERSDSYRFIFEEDATYSSISFGNGGFALVGNPYPSSLDFTAFYTANLSAIANSYQIWTGTGFATYNGTAGGTADSPDQYIAPMQSFIVRKIENGNGSFTPVFNAETMAVARPTNSTSQLRASENIADKLEITASYGNKATHTWVANREGGSSTFGNKDSRKLMLGISSVPEVYTIKESENGKTGVSVNIINTDNILIPLALATSHEGETSFIFKGMDAYNAQITLIDRAENNKRIPLTGNSFEYKFNYVPKRINDRIVADEDRFVLELTPAHATGLNAPTEQTLVYSKDKTIHLVNSSAGSIKQVFIYNAQGRMMYANGNVVASSYKIDAGNLPEICIVKIVTDKGVKNVKVLVK